MTFELQQPDFDMDLFVNGKSTQFSRLLFNDREIDRAIEFLSQFSQTHPVSNQAIALLGATSIFRSATTQDPFFAELRRNTKTDAEFEQMIDETNQAFQMAISQLDKRSVENYKFLKSVISYCKESIKSQIEEMKTHHDRLYKKYLSKFNILLSYC